MFGVSTKIEIVHHDSVSGLRLTNRSANGACLDYGEDHEDEGLLDIPDGIQIILGDGMQFQVIQRQWVLVIKDGGRKKTKKARLKEELKQYLAYLKKQRITAEK